MSALDELAVLLRPPGGGIHLVSTGRAEQEALQRRLLGVRSQAEVDVRFRATLERVASARGVMLAVPSDVGAGYRRGANLGPQGLRTTLLTLHPDWTERAERLGLVDLGDVRCVPQLLHDEMLSPAQLAATRRALYGDAGSTLPVSPLSIAERALDLVLAVNPRARLFVMGGDHSTAYPAVRALHRARAGTGGPWGVVQCDAHTDLLEERLGVRLCFGTWSWHANELLGRQGRLTQVGIRASGRPRAHWETTLGVRQFWADEVRAAPEATLDAVVAHVRSLGLDGVYFSNDVDGTDSAWVSATGTPEPTGLEPDWVLELVHRLGEGPGILGGDVMELAPDLGRTPEATERSLAVAARYWVATVEAALGSGR